MTEIFCLGIGYAIGEIRAGNRHIKRLIKIMNEEKEEEQALRESSQSALYKAARATDSIEHGPTGAVSKDGNTAHADAKP